ncbi:hypothetical protein [Sphingopyxis terrae]|uniref:hypothetical protein n=2 Tax=Sphingopyxis terrae TaxID=33052 RepID=UPI00362736DE
MSILIGSGRCERMPGCKIDAINAEPLKTPNRNHDAHRVGWPRMPPIGNRTLQQINRGGRSASIFGDPLACAADPMPKFHRQCEAIDAKNIAEFQTGKTSSAKMTDPAGGPSGNWDEGGMADRPASLQRTDDPWPHIFWT